MKSTQWQRVQKNFGFCNQTWQAGFFSGFSTGFCRKYWDILLYFFSNLINMYSKIKQKWPQLWLILIDTVSKIINECQLSKQCQFINENLLFYNHSIHFMLGWLLKVEIQNSKRYELSNLKRSSCKDLNLGIGNMGNWVKKLYKIKKLACFSN